MHSIEFHPDGLMLATGLKGGIIKIWDIRTQEVVKELSGYSGKGDVISLAFSNKGINFAAAWKGSNVCRVFDLRKMDAPAYEVVHAEGSQVNSVAFDNMGGSLVSAGGKEVRISTGKKWDEQILSTQAHEAVVNVAK